MSDFDDPSTHVNTKATWLSGGILELCTRQGTNRAYTWGGLVIEQGRTMNLLISWEDERGSALNLASGYTAAFQVRSQRGASTALLSLTQGSGITLGAGVQGSPNIVVRPTAAQTAALTFSRAWYELAVTHTASSTVQRLLQGACQLSRKIAA